MAELKSLAGVGAATKTAPSKTQFMEKTGAAPKVLRAPKSRVRKGSDTSSRIIKMMLFGSWSTGKTFAIKELLELGFKILVVTTDLGGDGLLSVELPLRREGKAHLLDNLYSVVLNGYEEVEEFLAEPAVFFPEIYDVGINLVMWDGFSGFQQIDLMAAVGSNAEDEALDKPNAKTVSNMRASGSKLEMNDWGVVRNETLKKLDAFCSLHNKKTGELWHKIVTCQLSIKSKQTGDKNSSVLTEMNEPFLSGAGGKHMAGAFDLIMRTTVKTEKNDDDGAERKYYYVIAPNQNNSTKNRGFDLPPQIEGSMGKLWVELERQAGIVRGATDENVKSEVLLQVEGGE